MEQVNKFKAAMSAVFGLLTGLWGWLGWLAVGWIACMAMDYLTGSAAACKEGEWSSGRAREGVWHKAGMIAVVLAAAGADLLISVLLEQLPLVPLPVPYGGLACPMVLVWYILTELGSILENAVQMGAPVPAWLTGLLAAGKNAVDQAGEQIGGGTAGESPDARKKEG